MRFNLLPTVILVFFAAINAFAVEPEPAVNNEELARIYELDQADRNPGPESIDWAEVSRRDAKRRRQVLELLRKGELRTSEDFRHAAMVFQHGETIEDFRLALSMAWVAATIDPKNESAKWLTAAAWDRLLMNQDQPQWYGTQYRRTDSESEWQLYDVLEGAVTDEERKELNVPSLAESKERLKRMNKK